MCRRALVFVRGRRDGGAERRGPHRRRTHPGGLGAAPAHRDETPDDTSAAAPAPVPPLAGPGEAGRAGTSSAPTACWPSPPCCSSSSPWPCRDTFPTLDNISSILSNQSIPAVLALGAMVPIVTGNVRPVHRLRPRPGARDGDAAHRRRRLALAAGLPRGGRRRARSSASFNGVIVEFAPDRLLHRHPRHRQHAVRPHRLDHRRRPDRPRPAGPAGRLHRPLRLHVPRPAGPRLLRARAGRRPLAAAGAAAARPVSVRHRLEPAAPPTWWASPPAATPSTPSPARG